MTLTSALGRLKIIHIVFRAFWDKVYWTQVILIPCYSLPSFGKLTSGMCLLYSLKNSLLDLLYYKGTILTWVSKTRAAWNVRSHHVTYRQTPEFCISRCCANTSIPYCGVRLHLFQFLDVCRPRCSSESPTQQAFYWPCGEAARGMSGYT